MSESYEAIVYDLDGTLVRLDVDWEAARRDAAAALSADGVDPSGMGLWDVFERAHGTPARQAVESVLAEHERAGARSAERLPLADEVSDSMPVGVCSLNCEAACRIALDVHDIVDRVDAVVGRDSVETYKPDPAPLLAVIDEIDAQPADTLFVGDGTVDERAADAAGVGFQYVSERLAAAGEP